MTFYAKLAVFWIAVWGGLFFLRLFPNSRIARVAFSWHGPIPEPGELKSRYLWRWSGYALSWFAQIVFVFALGILGVWWYPEMERQTFFLVVWTFALPILGGMAMLGAFIAACAAMKAAILGPNPVLLPGGQGRS